MCGTSDNSTIVVITQEATTECSVLVILSIIDYPVGGGVSGGTAASPLITGTHCMHHSTVVLHLIMHLFVCVITSYAAVHTSIGLVIATSTAPYDHLHFVSVGM